jgi:hypothetical protein
LIFRTLAKEKISKKFAKGFRKKNVQRLVIFPLKNPKIFAIFLKISEFFSSNILTEKVGNSQI